MNKAKNWIWGIVLIAVGVVWGLDAGDIIDIDLFFNGWWTLFIIVPSAIGLFTSRHKTASVLGLIIGIALLLSCNFDLSEYDAFIFPAVLVAIGIVVIVNTFSGKKKNEYNPEQVIENPDNAEYYASFAGQKYAFYGTEFKGGKFSATFGGIDLDLRNITLEHDIVIEVDAVFGGIDIFIPDGVKIAVKSNSLFGGVSNKSQKCNPNGERTIFINAKCLFGGVDIK